MIKSFDRPTCRLLRTKLEAVLAEAGIEGVSFDVGNMSFSTNEVSIKLVAKTEGAAEDKTAYVKQMCEMHNITKLEGPNGRKIVDFHPKKRKFPFIVADSRGRQWKLSPEAARREFA